MIILGLILLIIGLVAKITILWTIGVVLVIGLILLLLARWAGPSAAADIFGNNAGGGVLITAEWQGHFRELALRAGAPEFPASAPFVMTASLVKPVPVAHSGASDARRFPGAFYWGVATSAIGLTGLALGRPSGGRAGRIAVVSGTGVWPCRGGR